MPKYDNYHNIPARVFFEIRDTGNYQLLCPKPKEKGLEAIFVQIYDEYFMAMDNKEAEEYLLLSNQITDLTAKIACVNNILILLYWTKTTREFRYNWLDELQKRYGIYIDREKVFIDEIERVQNQDLAFMKNDLNFLKFELKSLTKKDAEKVGNYYDRIASLNKIHGRTLDEKMMLPMYVAEEKSALATIAANKAANTKH